MSTVVTLVTLSATEARSRFYSLIDEAAASHHPIRIAGKRNNAVLVSEENWNSIQETLYLVSIPGMRESILKGVGTPVSKCATRLKW